MEFYAIPTDAPKEDEAKFILFRPLLGLAFIGNQAMVNLTQQALINQLPAEKLQTHNSIISFLKTIGFLQDDPPHPVQPDSKKFSPVHAVLLMTNRCQMRCIYCYASGGEQPPEDLSLDTGKTVIDIAHQNAVNQNRRRFNLSFHGGGEPTMAWRTIVTLTEYARKKALPAHINLTSNGIWSSEQQRWIIDHLNSISLSMDGRPSVQNHNRPFADGSDSSEVVLSSLRSLDAHRKNYTIRMTAIPPWDDLPKSIEFLSGVVQHCRGIQVEPAFNTERGHHTLPDNDQAEAFCSAFLKAHQIAKNAGLNLRYSGARVNRPVATFCSAPFNTLIVNPNNQLVTCYEVTDEKHPLYPISNIGKLDEGQLLLHTNSRQNLHHKMSEKRDSCRDCFCYWSCAGDCYSRTLSIKNGETIDLHSRCIINQTLTKELILHKIEEGNGVARLF